MNAAQAERWAAARAGRAAAQGAAESLGVLAAGPASGDLSLDFVEAAVDSERGAARLKLVHVVRPRAGLDAARLAELCRLRERALARVFAATPGLDAGELRALYTALGREGAAGRFLPVVGVECDARSGAFGEVSLYCDEGAAALLPALAAAVGAPAPRADRLAAVGFDFRAGEPARLKLYRARRWEELAARGEARALAALPESHRLGQALTLARRPRGGSWERPRKLYLAFVERLSRAQARTVAELARACGPGPLRAFLTELVAQGAGPHVVDYLGCEGGRLEAYFGQPGASW